MDPSIEEDLLFDPDRVRYEVSIVKDFVAAFEKQQQEVLKETENLSDFFLERTIRRKYLGEVMNREVAMVFAGSTMVCFGFFRAFLRTAPRLNKPTTSGKNGSPFRGQAGENVSGLSWAWNAGELLADACISASCGVYVATHFVSEEHFWNAFPSAPLTKGRSDISDDFCGALARELRRQEGVARSNEKNDIPQDVHEDILINPNLDQLRVFSQFVAKCHERQTMGLPMKESLPVAEEEGQGDSPAETREGEGDWTKEDVSSFVMDQEEEEWGSSSR